MTEVVWTKRARDDLERLASRFQDDIAAGVTRYANQQHGDVKKLRGAMAGVFRLRIGDYRVFFALEDGRIVVYRVHHRQSAYR